MKSSVFGTNLKIALKNKDGCHKDNGKTKRTKRYTMEDLARDAGYSVHAVYGWTKNGDKLPSLTELKKIADILDVDTAFLLGEQVCQRNASQTICNATELNEMSAKVLTQLKGVKSYVMNELLNHNGFEKLIQCIWEYTHSQNKDIMIIDTIDGDSTISYSGNEQKAIMKYKVTEIFGEILDDIYNSHQQEAINAKIGVVLKEMRNSIESCISKKDNEFTRMGLLKMASSYQDKIRKLSPDYGLCKFTPEEIIDNFDLLKEKYL